MGAPWPPPKTAQKAANLRANGLLTLDEVARQHIIDVLAAAGGSVSVTAVVLGIRRQSLQRILRRWNITRDDVSAAQATQADDDPATRT
jgi:transcriptional regulator of acetoin/glycerol metabolism